MIAQLMSGGFKTRQTSEWMEIRGWVTASSPCCDCGVSLAAGAARLGLPSAQQHACALALPPRPDLRAMLRLAPFSDGKQLQRLL